MRCFQALTLTINPKVDGISNPEDALSLQLADELQKVWELERQVKQFEDMIKELASGGAIILTLALTLTLSRDQRIGIWRL